MSRPLQKRRAMQRASLGFLFLVSVTFYFACGGDVLLSGSGADVGTDDSGLLPDTSTTADGAPTDASTKDDAAAVDASSDAGSGGLVDAGDAVDAGAPGYYVDPASGLDTNAGTLAAPFETAAKAAAVAHAGDTIWLLDGIYDPTNQGTFPVTFASGVNIEAVHSHAAVLRGQVFFFVGTNTITGIEMDRFVTTDTDSQIQVVAGANVTIVDPYFVNIRTVYPIAITGGVVTITGTEYLSGRRLVSISAGSLTITGGNARVVGQMDDAECSILASGTSVVTLSGFTLAGGDRNGIGLLDDAHVSLTNGASLHGIGSRWSSSSTRPQTGAAIVLGGSPTLDVIGSSITNSGWNGIKVGQEGEASPAAPTIHLTNATVTMSSGKALTVYRTMSLTLSVTGSTIVNNQEGGIAQTSSFGPAPVNAVVRGSLLKSNNFIDLDFSVTAGSTVDLGKSTADPGGNTLLSSFSVSNSVSIDAPDAFVTTAVGNTWNAGLQGADDAGTYAAGTSVTGPVTGRNYALTNASVLQL